MATFPETHDKCVIGACPCDLCVARARFLSCLSFFQNVGGYCFERGEFVEAGRQQSVTGESREPLCGSRPEMEFEAKTV